MDATHVRASELARYLSDVEEEFSPSRLESYTAEVKDLLPRAACDDLDAAFLQLAEAQANIRRAVQRLGLASLMESLHM